MLLELKDESLSGESPSSGTRTSEHDLSSPSIECAREIQILMALSITSACHVMVGMSYRVSESAEARELVSITCVSGENKGRESRMAPSGEKE